MGGGGWVELEQLAGPRVGRGRRRRLLYTGSGGGDGHRLSAPSHFASHA